MKLDIIYEDKNLVAINKPAGLVVNRSDTVKNSKTLQDLIEEQISPFIELRKELTVNPDFIAGLSDNHEIPYNQLTEKQKKDLSYKDFIKRDGIVHRLDKDTTGVILVAKNYDTFLILQKQFADRKVKKMYIAITFGHIKDAKEGDLIIIDAPIDRNPNNREKFAVVEGGREARTEIEIVEKFETSLGKFSLVNCFPKTGRTHQIRVHLTAINTPVVGDFLYSGKTRYKKFEHLANRQMLHATQIEFFHPKTGKPIEIKAKLPKDMKDVLNLLNKNRINN